MKQQKLPLRLLAPALALAALSLGLLFGPARTISSTQKPSQKGGIYTDAQAARGQAVYDNKCASCHGLRLEGGSASALSGDKFTDRWARGDKSVDDLYYITRTQMPFGAGNTLSKQQYIDTVASILKANGYKAGTQELPADPALLKQIKIEPQVSLKEGVVQTPAESGASASASTNGAGGAPDPSSKGPSQQELNAAPSNAADWLMSNHDYTGQRYVDLKQIHNNPVVYRGVMYITTTNSTIAIDATNCRVKWRHNWKPKSVEVYPPNRGAAIKDGRVVRATTDGYLFALDIETGKPFCLRNATATEKNEGSFNMAR